MNNFLRIQCRREGLFFAVFLLGIIFIVLPPSQSDAVPASPELKSLQQPDGTKIKARQWGDESYHGWETEEGYTLQFDDALKAWTYAVRSADGGLMSSGRIAGKGPVPAGSGRNLRPTSTYRYAMPLKRLTREGKQLSSTVKPALQSTQARSPQLVTPSAGTANVPVILINFSNTTTTYAAADFTTLLFGTGNNSMKDFYEEVSYGAFSVSAGPAGVKGWYSSSHSHDYFSPNEKWVGTLVREAVAAADTDVNFSFYDQDGDCYVDVVNIVHQGTGAEASYNNTDIWSHRWNLNSSYDSGYSDGGAYTTNDLCTANTSSHIIVNDYIIQPEVLSGTTSSISTIGVFAHEFAHSLGLPDLYDTDSSSTGIGSWSLMAYGSWNGVDREGDRPAHLDAWSKFFLDWVTPMLVDGTLTSEAIDTAATTPDVYQLLGGTSLSGEYFLVENRQKTSFDAGLPGSGLLVWHIDGNLINSTISANTVNDNECIPPYDCSANHYGVALVQADNRWDLEGGTLGFGNYGDASDPYSATTNSALSDTTSPAAVLYDGTKTGLSVSLISASTTTMTATLSAPADYLVISGASTLQEGGTSSYSAVMHWGNGTSVAITPTWSIEPASPYASIDSSGLLTTQPVPADQAVTIQAVYTSGKTYSATKPVTIFRIMPLAEAVDSGLTFSTGGNAAWFGQAAISHDGTDAAQSGVLQDNQSAWFETTVSGPGSGSFFWKVSSETFYDFLRFYIDGAQKNEISGEVDWAQVAFTVTGSGNHTLRWEYSKDYMLLMGSDTAWVDQVTFVSTACSTASISPVSASLGEAGGTGDIAVTADGSCSWTAISNDAWIAVTGGATGAGNGTVNYLVSENTGSARSGTITAAGKTFTITQAAAACVSLITPTAGSFVWSGGSGDIAVTIGSACTWTAVSNDSWITVTGGTTGTGNGNVTYDVAEHIGGARSGTITAAGQTFTVSQSASWDGDLDGGGVSSTDALRALRIAAGLQTASSADLLHGDVAPLVNGAPQPDQKIDVSDVVAILRRAVGLLIW